MQTSRFANALLAVTSVMVLATLLSPLAIVPASAQERIYERGPNDNPVSSLLPPARVSNPALDAAFGIANLLDTASSGLSGDAYREAIKAAAEAGQPQAQWELAKMYENGEGVDRDVKKAFDLLQSITSENANTSSYSIDAQPVAMAFIRLGEIYRDGLTEIDIVPDQRHAQAMFLHAATHFSNADAQYRIAKLYLEDAKFGTNPIQGARWLSLSARKGHVIAQATLGDMLFNGVSGAARPVEGLMWLGVARQNIADSADAIWVIELHEAALAAATPQERLEAEDHILLLNERLLTN